MDSACKRQKRAIAGEALKAMVKKTKKRPSVAKPRPECKISPGSFQVASTNSNDVLSGRGAGIYNSPGNVQMRSLVEQRRPEYLAEEQKKLRKPFIAAQIVSTIRNMNPPGRFLEKNKDDHLWWEIGDKRAIKKVQQQLREGAPKHRSSEVVLLQHGEVQQQHPVTPSPAPSLAALPPPSSSPSRPILAAPSSQERLPTVAQPHGWFVSSSSQTFSPTPFGNSEPDSLSNVSCQEQSQISALTDGSRRRMMPPAARIHEDSMSWLSNVSLVGSHNSTNCSELNFEALSVSKLSLSEASAATALMSITTRESLGSGGNRK